MLSPTTPWRAIFRIMPCFAGTIWLAGCGSSSSAPDSTGPTEAAAASESTQAPADACSLPETSALAAIASKHVDSVLKAASSALGIADRSVVLPLIVNAIGSDLPREEKRNSAVEYLTTFLGKRALAPENLETSDERSATFLLGADVTCPGFDDSTPPLPTQEECRDFLTSHELRMVVSPSCDEADGLHLELRYGTERTLLLAAELSAAEFGVAVEVGESLRAFQDAAAANPPGATNESSGRLSVLVHAVAGSDATLTVATDQITLAGGSDASAERLDAAPSPGLLTLTASPSPRTIDGALALGSLGATLSFDDFVRLCYNRTTMAPADDTVRLEAPGVRANLLFEADSDRVTVSGLGFENSGALSFMHSNDTLLAVDLGSSSSQGITCAVTATADNELELAFASGLDVRIHHALAPVASSIVDPQEFAKKDDMGIVISGGAPRVTLLNATDGRPALFEDGYGPLIRVEEGQLSLTSSSLPASDVTVPAGQCLLRLTPPYTGAHEMLRELDDGACP